MAEENRESDQKQDSNAKPWRWVVLFAVLQLSWITWLALVAFGVVG